MAQFLSVWALAQAATYREVLDGIDTAEEYLKRPLTRDEIVSTLAGIGRRATATVEGGVRAYKAQRQPEQPYLSAGPDT